MLTEVTVTFSANSVCDVSPFGSGTYSVSGNQVTIVVNNSTSVFNIDGNMMQGALQGMSTILTKQ